MGVEEIKIFIPTKNRVGKQKTYEILKSLNLEPILVIEPQEENSYKGKFNYILLPDNDRGISFSRNYIIDYSRQKGYNYIIQIDDDLNGFYRKEGKKLIKDNSVFIKALERFIEYKGYCGLEYQQFAWCQDCDESFNRSVEVCLMMYLPYIPEDVKFDPKSKEDKDFAIQLLMHGKETMKMNNISLSVPTVGSNEGGLHDWYSSKKDADASYYMLEKWGNEIITIKDKKDRIDAMVNWKGVINKYNRENDSSLLF